MKIIVLFILGLYSSAVYSQDSTRYSYLDSSLTGATKYYIFVKKNKLDKFGNFIQTIYCDYCPDAGKSIYGTFKEDINNFYITIKKTKAPEYSSSINSEDLSKIIPVEWFDENKKATSFSIKINSDTTLYSSSSSPYAVNIPKSKLNGNKVKIEMHDGKEYIYGDTLKIYSANKFIFALPLVVPKGYKISYHNKIYLKYSEENKVYKLEKKKFKKMKYNSSKKHWE